MKKIILGLILIVSISSFAEPSGMDSMKDIGKYSVIRIINEVNVPPSGRKWLKINNFGQSYCQLERTAINGDYDVAVSGNLKVEGIGNAYSTLPSGKNIHGVSLRVIHPYIKEINCFEFFMYDGQLYVEDAPTMNEFYKIIEGKAELILNTLR